MSPAPFATLAVSGRLVILDSRDAAALAGRDLVLLRGRPHVRFQDAGRWRITPLARLVARPGPGLCAHAPPVSPEGPIDLRRHRVAVLTRGECRRLACKRPGFSSRFRGVVYVAAKGRYRAVLWHRQRVIHGGYYRDEADAAKARDALALSLFGHAPLALNFPARTSAATLAIRPAGRRSRITARR